MFEQESYDKATKQAASLPEGELFSRYEIKPWDFSPVIYKILAASAVLHIAVLAFMAQTNVLTMRGCDSPWVGRVCQVVDMTYVGALLFGTEREYADVAYDRTELEPEDEITYIIVSGDKLEYPEGYFQLANPEQFMAVSTDTGFPPPPSAYTPPTGSSYTPSIGPLANNDDLLNTPQKLPSANPNAFNPGGSLFEVQGDTPNARLRNARNRRIRPPANNSTTPDPGETVAGTNTNTQAAPPPSPTPADEAAPDKFGIFINKRPLRDRAKETLAKLEQNSLKLDKPFKVVIEGTLGLARDGKTVVLKNPKPVAVDPNVPNDPEMVKLAQEWVLAVGDAGWLGYLEKLELKKKPSSKKVVITVEQNDAEFVASVRSQVTSPNEANTLATSLRNLITLGALGAKDDDLTFLKAATTGSDGNDVILNIKFDKPVVQQMIQRKLAEEKAKPAEPSSTAINSGTGNTAAK